MTSKHEITLVDPEDREYAVTLYMRGAGDNQYLAYARVCRTLHIPVDGAVFTVPGKVLDAIFTASKMFDVEHLLTNESFGEKEEEK